MPSRLKPLLFWAIWFAVIATTIGFIVHTASSAQREVARGAGARALIKRPAPPIPPLPKIVAPARPPLVWYFAAVSIDPAGLESPFSNELLYTNDSRINFVTLAWDSTGTDLTYAVYQGRSPRSYTNRVEAGSNRRVSFPLVRQLTNVVVTVSGSTNWSMTNPTAKMMLFKGAGLTITKRYQ